VIQNVGTCIEHRMQRVGLALEVGNQHLDAGGGLPLPDLPDGVGEYRRASIFQVIAIHRRDDDVREVEFGDRFADPGRFGSIDRLRTPVSDRAVPARACADIAEDHEGRRAVRPALADVRALRFFTHRMQVQIAHQALEPEIRGGTGRTHLQPVGLRDARCDRRKGNDSGHVSSILTEIRDNSLACDCPRPSPILPRHAPRWDV
jgi:hypothetical protein